MVDGLASDDARQAVLAMLDARAEGVTICPSEVARSLAAQAGGSGEWRRLMPVVHDAIDGLLGDGVVRLSWKGRALASRYGPYRIAARGR